jgi:radical SAM protein with 4Fe4S-binding SPASM domain
VESHKASLWEDKQPLLDHIDMELTERCNNNCIHCCINLSSDNNHAMRKELATGKIKEILKDAASLGCLTVRFTGGEPLLRKDFEELYLFARKLGLKVIIFTNATLMTRNLAELFTRIPPLEKIEITFFGMKKKSYEAVTRVPGSYENARKGIDFLLDKKIPFVVKSALLPPNKNDVEEFETWASTIPWMDRPPSYAMFFDLRCRRDSEEKNRRIRNLRLSPEEGMNIFAKRHQEYIKNMKTFSSKFMRPLGDQIFSCGAGISSGCVDAYGHFQPCMMLRHPDTVYDLKKGSLEDALTCFVPTVRQMTAVDPGYRNRCARCFLKSLCDQCPAKSWMESGSLDRPVEYLCEIAHAQAIYLGLLEKDEKAWEVRNWKKRIQKFTGKKPVVLEKYREMCNK